MADRGRISVCSRRMRPYFVFLILAGASFPGVLAGRALVPACYQQQWAPWGVPEARPERLWNPIQADGILQFYPWRHFAREELLAGEIPLWNPYQFCGAPFVANGQSAVFYPPNLLFWLLPTPYAFGVAAVVRLFLAGTFTYWLGLALGLRRSGATFAGVVFMLGGFLITWTALPTLVDALVWLPLALCAGKRHFDGPGGLLWPLAMGAAIACTLLAGHLQIAYYSLVTLIVWLIYLKIVTWRRIGFAATVRLELQEKTGFILGLLGGAIQLLPTLELARLGHRQGPADFAGLAQWALSRYDLARLVAPDLLGNPARGWYLTPLTQDYTEMCGYVGVTALALVGPALCAAWWSRQRRFDMLLLGAVAGTALLVAMGTKVGHVLFAVLPGFDRLSGLPRILCLFQLSVAVLAGFGLDAIRLAAPEQRRRLRGAALVAAAVSGLVLAQAAPDVLGESRRSLQPVLVGFALLALSAAVCGWISRRHLALAALVLAAGDLLAFGHGYNPTAAPREVYAETPLLHSLASLPPDERVLALTDSWGFGSVPVAALPPNAAMVFRIRDVQGYDSLFPASIKTALMHANGGVQPCPAANGNMVLLGQVTEDPTKTIDPAWLERMRVTRVLSRHPLPENWGMTRLEEPMPRLVLYGRRDPLPGARVIRLTANACDIDAGTASGPIEVAETDYPGWYAATPEGLQPLPHSAARPLRLSPTTATRHVYLPGAYLVGAFVSLLALAAAMGVVAFSLAKRAP